MTPMQKLRKATRTRFRNVLHYHRRVRRVTTTMSRQQFERLAQHARLLQRRLAPFVRDAALAYVGRHHLLPRNLEAGLRGVIVHLRRAGTNLNQIAARANVVQRASGFDLIDARVTVRKLEQDVSRVLDLYNPASWS